MGSVGGPCSVNLTNRQTTGVPTMTISVAKFRDVSAGLQPWPVRRRRDHDQIESLDDLPPSYKQLLDQPVTCVLGLNRLTTAGSTRTPMWFDHDGHTSSSTWPRTAKGGSGPHPTGKVSILLMNLFNPYHWVSIKGDDHPGDSSEDDPHGRRLLVTQQVDKIWTKYTNNEPPYGLRDPVD